MLDFHEKRKLKSFLYSWPTIAVLCVVVIFLGFSVAERYTTERIMAERRAALETELRTLESQAAALEFEVNRLKSDRGIEEELRDRYQISKKGEEIVVLVDDGADVSVPASSTATKTEERGYFDFLPW